MLNRRGLFSGLLAFSVAPAIIRTPGLLMPIKPEFKAVSTIEWHDNNINYEEYWNYIVRQISIQMGIPDF